MSYKKIKAIWLVLVISFFWTITSRAENLNQIPIAPPRQVRSNSQVDQSQNNSDLSLTKMQTGVENSIVEATIEHTNEPINILFLLDCSFSMKEKMGDHMQKMEAAKQVLQNALARIPGDVNIGLRVFGLGDVGSSRGFFADDCRQTALLVPLGQGNRRAIIEQVRNIRAFGMTPLEFALEQAAESDFAGAQGKKIIILISDGADTCGGDPCRFIRMLPAYGIKIKVDVVGLDLKRDHVARDQLNCITQNSGGKYYDASTAGQLIDSVSESVNKAISGRVLPKAGAPTLKNYQIEGNQ